MRSPSLQCYRLSPVGYCHFATICLHRHQSTMKHQARTPELDQANGMATMADSAAKTHTHISLNFNRQQIRLLGVVLRHSSSAEQADPRTGGNLIVILWDVVGQKRTNRTAMTFSHLKISPSSRYSFLLIVSNLVSVTSQV